MWRRLLIGVFVAVQVGVPLALFIVRQMTGEKFRWGWAMFS